MNKEQVLEMINKHNDSIDSYINGELAEKLGAKNGKVSLNDWFKAQSLLQEQNFYKKGKAIQDTLRGLGWDIKMNMQSNKLVYHGRQ